MCRVCDIQCSPVVEVGNDQYNDAGYLGDLGILSICVEFVFLHHED